MPMLEVSEFREEDIDGLRNLFLSVRVNTFLWADPSSFTLLDFDKETAAEYILVAKDEHELLGFISIWIPDGFIHHLFIHVEHQGKGIGTKLLKAAIDKIALPVQLKCLTKNIKSLNFYRKKGFVEKGKGISKEGDYVVLELKEKLL